MTWGHDDMIKWTNDQTIKLSNYQLSNYQMITGSCEEKMNIHYFADSWPCGIYIFYLDLQDLVTLSDKSNKIMKNVS